MSMRDIGLIIDELRGHPECMAVTVWLSEDAESAGIDPDSVDWDQVESDMTERGWDSLECSGESAV